MFIIPVQAICDNYIWFNITDKFEGDILPWEIEGVEFLGALKMEIFISNEEDWIKIKLLNLKTQVEHNDKNINIYLEKVEAFFYDKKNNEFDPLKELSSENLSLENSEKFYVNSEDMTISLNKLISNKILEELKKSEV